jgi:hypothetical protein
LLDALLFSARSNIVKIGQNKSRFLVKAEGVDESGVNAKKE